MLRGLSGTSGSLAIGSPRWAICAGAATDRRIDATGLTAAPGFIDVQGQSEFNILVDNRAASKITQGVTTEITGEGSSIAPVNDRMIKDKEDVSKKYGVMQDWHTLAQYFQHLERTKSAINLGTFVGAGSVRNLVLGTGQSPRDAGRARPDATARRVGHGRRCVWCELCFAICP